MPKITGDYQPEEDKINKKDTSKKSQQRTWLRSNRTKEQRNVTSRQDRDSSTNSQKDTINKTNSDSNNRKTKNDASSLSKSSVSPKDGAYKYIFSSEETAKGLSTSPRDAAYKYISDTKANSNESNQARNKPKDASYKYLSSSQKENKSQLAVAIALLIFIILAFAGISSNTDSRHDKSLETGVNSARDNSLNEKIAKASPPEEANRSDTHEINPAIEINDYFTFKEDSDFDANLNSKSEYRRAAGDLARIQEKMLRKRSESRTYPSIIIGDSYWVNDKEIPIISESTAGAYHIKEQLIQINFKADSFSYSNPIEVLTTLAHEYGHHLTEISVGINSMSGLESELVADCFAGVVMGYWAKYDKLTEAELKRAGNLMIRVSKHSESMTDDHGDPGQRLGAFLAGAIRTNGKVTRPYANFCTSLDKIINFNVELP
jgi:hypothetical protein